VWSGLRVGNGRLCVEWFESGQQEIVCGVVCERVTGDCVWSGLGVGNGRLSVEWFESGQQEIVCGVV
jgi:hypothetical protein